MLIHTARDVSALAAMTPVALFLLMLTGLPGGGWHTRIGLLLRRFADQRGDVPVGDGGGEGGDGTGDGGTGDGAGGGQGGGGNGGEPAQLEQDARAAIDALRSAGAEIPAALSKAVDELAQARKDAARYRTERNGNGAEVNALQEQMTAIAKHLGLEDASDPVKVAEAAKAERDALASEVKTLKIGQALTRAAKAKGADADALADSRSFMATVEQLDPSDAKFAAALEAAVDKAVKDNPKLKAPAARSGNEFNGGGDPVNRPKTLEDAVAARIAG